MTTASTRSLAAVWAARLLAALAVALAAAAVALPLVSGLGYLDRLMQTPEVVVAVSFSVIGALLVPSVRANRIGWLLLAVGFCSGLYAASASYVVLVLGADVEVPMPPGATLALAAAWVTGWAWFPPWLLVTTLLPQVVPHGRVLSPRWRWGAWTSLGVVVLGVLIFAISPGPVGFLSGTENPLAIPSLAPMLDALLAGLDVVVLLLVAVSVLSVVVRLVRADGAERRQIGWVGYAVVLAVAIIVLAPSGWVNLAVLLIPAGIAVAALRYRLYDLDLVVNRTLVIGVLLGGAALAYVALVAWVGALFGTSDGVVPFLAAFAVALAFHPARVRVQRTVDRLFHGRRGDPYGLLQDLDRALREAESPRQALAEATGTLREGLRLPGVAVLVAMPDGTEHRSQSGTLGDDPVEVALRLHGEQVGSMVVARRAGRGGGHLGEADLRVLAALTGPLASAAFALRLAGDLEASRRALVDAREEERRRLRRDLHDGLGPQLAGVVMGLDAMRSTLQRGDSGGASTLAGTIADQARTAVEDVRRLVSGLRPPVLDDLGLLGALRSSGPAAAEGGPRVTITSHGSLTDLPAAVEVAAYRITQEALTNAVRHADASAVDVLLRAEPDAVTVRVTDDGRGVAARTSNGVGVASMRERAEELGGWCTVSAAEDGRGTTVRAHLPRAAL